MVHQVLAWGRALQGSGATGQECAAWVVIVAVAGLLASEKPVHFGKRVARLGSGLAGCGLAGAGAPVGAGTSLTTGWSRLRYRARKQPRHALRLYLWSRYCLRGFCLVLIETSRRE